MSQCIILDCLLPNSIVVPLTCCKRIPLSALKDELWQEAKKYPLYSVLGPPEKYVLVGVIQDAKQEEFWDETRCLSELKLAYPIIKVVEPRGNKEEEVLNYEISQAIGRSIHDLEDAKDPELQEFRKDVIDVVADSVRARQQCNLESLACYQHPPELEATPKLPESIEKKLDEGYLTVKVWSGSQGNSESLSLRITWDTYPEGIIAEALAQQKSAPDSQSSSQYVLKICGINEYLLASRPITQYKTIRQSVAKNKTPQLLMMSRGKLYASLNVFQFVRPSYVLTLSNETSSSAASSSVSLWHSSMDGRLKVNILRAKNICIKDGHKIYVKAAVFHGEEQLCEAVETQHIPACEAEWEEWVQFDLPVQEIPRAATLSLSVCSEKKQTDRRKKKEKLEHSVIVWGNICLFDYRNRLICNKIPVMMSSPHKGCEEVFNPLGATGQALASDTTCLEVGFERRFNQHVTFPDSQQLEDYARYIIKLDRSKRKSRPENSTHLAKIREIASHDLGDLTTEDKEFLWNQRILCMSVPDSLPRLLDAVKWSSRDQVSQMYLMLKEWPVVSLKTALELLQCKYPDPTVRSHAVSSLDKGLLDEELLQYLLQLIHTLKQEPYLDSALLRFLLRKSLTNAKIGHFFFWQMKASSHCWPGILRPLAILEAFCRGLGPGLRHLIHQVEANDKIAYLAESVKERNENFKDATTYLIGELKKSEYSSSLQKMVSHLNPSHCLGRLRTSECRIIDSARRPLCLVWDNSDPMAPQFSMSHSVIFKSGDDLRQDMLALQVIGIISYIWNMEGLDLCMMPYSCLATGNKMGVIEVVRDAKTIYSIQRITKFGAIQADSTQLFKWIRDKNKGPKFEQAIDNFTRSCAGYCVATFVLGIGDRHPSNIMVNNVGQIFHIDFGHFLGNIKKKFGINRERVPFVLTQDFLRVIAKGAENAKESEEFLRFQKLCGKAYLALRKHHHLILMLFTLMLSAGLPELQMPEDLAYLRKTLAVEATEEGALAYFQDQFCEAYEGAWITKLDWVCHAVAHRWT